MTAINSYSTPEAREPGGSVPQRKPPLGSAGARSALGALGITVLVLGCAGELDKDPNSFTYAFGAGTPTGGTGTGGSVGTTGGTMGTTGGSAAGGSVGTGGSGTGGGSAMIPPDDACVAEVFTSQCVACHGDQSLADLIGAGLSLKGTDLGKRLSMTKASYKGVTMNPGACVQGALIIDPAMPQNSILLKKVSGTQVCGGPMPAAPGLTGDNLKCIQDWIAKFKS